MRPLRYACPADRARLETRSDAVLVCANCGARVPVTKSGVALLDVIGSEQAGAFNAQYAETGMLTGAARERIPSVSEAFLDVVGKGIEIRGQEVLEVGCGTGEFTLGLQASRRVSDCDLYAFDHAIAGLEILSRSAAERRGNNRLYVSCQDASAMCFGDESFDLVFGNAILHHLPDVAAFLRSIRQLLKPGGCAVFAEPFAAGYALAMVLLRLAARSHGIPLDDGDPALGLFNFIAEDVRFRLQNAGRPAALAALTDKHLFTDEQIVQLAAAADLRITLRCYSEPEYYASFLEDVLSTYRIEHRDLTAATRELYAECLSYIGTSSFPGIFGHFKFLRFEKR